nr:hypothetical protein [Tanacetum cinerariifolium]
LYTPDFSDTLKENTGFWQATNPYEVSIEQVVTSPTKKKRATRNRKKRTIQSDDAPRQTPWTTEEEIALAKGWLAVSENSKHGSEGGSKRHKSTGSSSFNIESGEASINLNTTVGDNDEDEDALARLMVTEMTTHEKEERLAFLDIKRREVECREREIEQQDMRFYLQPYDHLTGDQRKTMDEIKAKIKTKHNLQD